MRNSVLFIMAWWLTTTLPPAQADDPGRCTAKSDDRTVPLVELYTSEGCSSCPPADQWLSTLHSRGPAPDRVVPLALHVDYWNNLGWNDAYAQKMFTERQYRLADLSRKHTVYTPQIVLNGRDFPRWRSQTDAAIHRINAVPARAHIALTLVHVSGQVDVTADAQTNNQESHAELYLALYENNLTRHIDAGENRGLTLHHDYVARQLIGPVALDENGSSHFTRSVMLDKAWKENDLGVAAFVQDASHGEVWQALALPLCR